MKVDKPEMSLKANKILVYQIFFFSLKNAWDFQRLVGCWILSDLKCILLTEVNRKSRCLGATARHVADGCQILLPYSFFFFLVFRFVSAPSTYVYICIYLRHANASLIFELSDCNEPRLTIWYAREGESLEHSTQRYTAAQGGTYGRHISTHLHIQRKKKEKHTHN